jgi:HEAT repeats
MKRAHHSLSAAALYLTSLAAAPQTVAAELTLPRDGWASWQVAAADAAPDWCCWSYSRNFRDASRTSCRLDGDQDGFGSRDNATTDMVRIYARTAGGRVDRLRVFGAACPVEAATPIVDLGSMTEDASARWLINLTRQSESSAAAREHVGDGVLAALAINRGNLARDAIAAIARDDARVETRKQAIFWLALLRGREGADITASVMFNDKNAEVREHAAFALGQSGAPRATADLIRLGTTDRDAEVRAQAWLWLAETEAPEAESAIFAALRKETDEEVLDGALAALSHLPDARATRALIATAEDRSLPRDLRKQAVFWLSQSESDAAHAYLEQVLTAN